MLAHDQPFVVVELSRLEQNAIRNGHLANMWQERSAGDHVDLLAGRPMARAIAMVRP